MTMTIVVRLILMLFVLGFLVFIFASNPSPGKTYPRWYRSLCRLLGERYCPSKRERWKLWLNAALVNELVFWEIIWGAPLLYRYVSPNMDLADLVLLQRWGWLISVIERVLRATVFGIGAGMLAPAILKEELLTVKTFQRRSHKGQTSLTREIFRAYISILVVSLWGMAAFFATISLLREAYYLLQVRAR